VLINKRLILAHFWLAFVVFGAALVLGAWQMFVRSPLNASHFNPEWFYRSVTAHGSAMGYVFPTLVAMGFGYAITEAPLEQPLVGRRWAWAGFLLVAVGAVVAMIPVSLGLASVLYTFYPPDDRQSLLLHRRGHGRGRLMDMGRADVDQSRDLEAAVPWKVLV
jgi:cytochrome c oxidase subunit 1